MAKRYLFLNFIFTFILSTGSVLACSVGEDFVRPSNFELVAMADAIVVAKATGGPRQYGSDGAVRFQVLQTLKGEAPGKIYDRGGVIGRPQKSDPYDLSSANKEAYSGACTRITYAMNGRYVLFLTKDSDGRFDLTAEAFSRINEDYFGPNSYWIKAIKYYLGVQSAYAPMEQLSILEEKYYALKQQPRSKFDQELADDIADHLQSRSPFKPTQYLLDSYAALEEGRESPFAIRSPDANKEKSQAEKLAVPVNGKPGSPDFDVEAKKLSILWALANGDHPDAVQLFERLSAPQNTSGAVIGVSARFFAKQGEYPRAIELINENAFRIVNNSSRAEVREFLRGALGIGFLKDDEGKRIWREDPYARNWWPEFILAVNQAELVRTGDDRISFVHEEMSQLRPADYRDRPIVTLALARSYDDAVVEWAVSEMEKLIEAGKGRDNDLYALPIGVLLLDYRTNNAEKINTVFCNSDTGRHVVLKYLGLYKDIYTEDLIYQLAAFNLDEGDKKTLLKSLYMFAALDRKEYLTNGRFANIGDAHELISLILKGQPIDLAGKTLKPLKCS